MKTLSSEELNKLVNYLSKQKYVEVFELMNILLKPDKKQEEKKPETKTNEAKWMRMQLWTKVLHRGMLQGPRGWMPVQEQGREDGGIRTGYELNHSLDGNTQGVHSGIFQQDGQRDKKVCSVWRD